MKALITEEFHELLIEELTSMGYSCELNYEIKTAEVIEIISDFELIVVNSKILLDKALLLNAKKLQTIIRIGSGLEIIDLDTCRELQIEVISTPEGNAPAVAEHCLALILSAFNHLHRAQVELRSGIWNRESNRGEELGMKTLAIIGCGHTGSRLVNLLSGFETKILIYDLVDISDRISNPNAHQVSLDIIFKEADLVSFHLPLTQETNYFFNFDFLQNFQKNIYLLNTSRGKVCDPQTIIEGLQSGKIIQAMLDVFENEPLVLTDQMKKMVENHRLLISPHIAGWTHQSKKRMAELAILKLKNLHFI